MSDKLLRLKHLLMSDDYQRIEYHRNGAAALDDGTKELQSQALP
jgi:hypothetical protein